ncbi:MAG: pyrroloquinoline quinone-dependent dehydrogenase [Proteobacteria bacterium]|nr:pyrroloquinoline quinone-dependent dehydrogenase [Pseudomonadota bacterium]
MNFRSQFTARCLVAVAALLVAGRAFGADTSWLYYGGDQGGQRYSAAQQITPANVNDLAVAWTYSTGDLVHSEIKRAAFENTPILAEGRLYVCSSFNEVSALDPGTGRPIWRFDPKLDLSVHYPNSFNCRGVAYWRATKPQSASCPSRIFLATNDMRLIALDAKSGRPCAGFGQNGTIHVDPGGKLFHRGEIGFTSPPVVSHGIVVVGSSMDDNQRVHELPGTVHAFDAETGAPKWSFDPLVGAPFKAGSANVWAPISADDARGLVFLPTTSPSPDFFGGLRLGDDRYAGAVVAVNVETGKIAWSFQTVHHNVWDYDLPAQPTLATVTYKGKTAPVVIQGTKQGLIFTLNRDTGLPFIPVQERKVPQDAATGEKLSPTQPFPIAPKPLAPHDIKLDDAFGLLWFDRAACRKAMAGLKSEGFYTPPSTQGTILYPFTGGGINWGGLSFDASRDVVYVNTSSAMHTVKLIPRKDFAAAKRAEPNKEISPQEGAPFGMRRDILVSPLGMPCNPPPWGLLHAIDMHDGHELWSVPLGTTEDLAPFSEYILGNTGTPNFGGPIATASGLVFIAAAMDNYLRAFDAKTGQELWRGRLPAGGQATPMTYVWKGRQYVIIAAGGHAMANTKRGDQIVAFALGN